MLLEALTYLRKQQDTLFNENKTFSHLKSHGCYRGGQMRFENKTNQHPRSVHQLHDTFQDNSIRKNRSDAHTAAAERQGHFWGGG
jgi:hypothetical protein